MGPYDDPISAGLDFAVGWKKDTTFAGRDALERRALMPSTRVIHVAMQDPSVRLWGEESVCIDGQQVGRLTSGAFGYTVGASVGLATVAADVDPDSARLSVRVRGDDQPARGSQAPFYDPAGSRVRG
jgi:4-methylaminobutanoate oxidase (formaldehyde-forming)